MKTAEISREQKDWRSKLSSEDAALLDELLQGTQKHSYAYKNASDPATAQLWTALVEMKKKQEKLNDLLVRLEKIVLRFENDEKAKIIKENPALKDLENF